MPFIKKDGVIGKVYVPEKKPEAVRKHNCKDCFSCQMCSDDRCQLCCGNKSCDEKNNDASNP